MKNLELKQQLIFCEKYKISPNELLLLEILLIAQEGDDPEIVKSYFTSPVKARGSTLELLSNLKESGVILKSYKIPGKGENFSPYDVPINKNIIKDFYRSSFEMGKELFEAYPQFGLVNGSWVGIRSVSKKFNSLEDFYCFYGKTIRFKPDIHNHIIELVNWANENNILSTTLCNFVVDHKWEELEALRSGDLGTVNTDAIKIV